MDVKNSDSKITEAIKYFREGFVSEAYLLLSDLKAEENPAALFTLGLCHEKAGELSQAISSFEKALYLLKKVSSAPLSVQMRAKENSETYIQLAISQIADKTYLNPMDEQFCALFSKSAEYNILLALIDTYKKKGMNEQAKKLSSGLTGPVFEAYKKEMFNVQ